jgi:GT2 family glycosyltransferase
MNTHPTISFITITYNGLNDTCDLIDSLKAHIRSVSYEIIVVDNASRRDEAAMIKEKYADVTAIRSEENLGFSGGNNLGIKVAKGDYIFIINNDTFIEEDGMQALIERLESAQKIGAVSPKIRYAAEPRNIQFTGFTPLSPITIRNSDPGNGEADNGQFDTAHPSPYLHGAAMLVKREVIERVGLMPEIFFLYYEEMDWCTNMTRHGYELWYEPRCTVFHKESQSTGQDSPLKTFYMTRNRMLYAWRNLSPKNRLLSVAYQMTVASGKKIVVELLHGHTAQAGAVVKGIARFITMKK